MDDFDFLVECTQIEGAGRASAMWDLEVLSRVPANRAAMLADRLLVPAALDQLKYRESVQALTLLANLASEPALQRQMYTDSATDTNLVEQLVHLLNQETMCKLVVATLRSLLTRTDNKMDFMRAGYMQRIVDVLDQAGLHSTKRYITGLLSDFVTDVGNGNALQLAFIHAPNVIEVLSSRRGAKVHEFKVLSALAKHTSIVDDLLVAHTSLVAFAVGNVEAKLDPWRRRRDDSDEEVEEGRDLITDVQHGASILLSRLLTGAPWRALDCCPQLIDRLVGVAMETVEEDEGEEEEVVNDDDDDRINRERNNRNLERNRRNQNRHDARLRQQRAQTCLRVWRLAFLAGGRSAAPLNATAVDDNALLVSLWRNVPKLWAIVLATRHANSVRSPLRRLPVEMFRLLKDML